MSASAGTESWPQDRSGVSLDAFVIASRTQFRIRVPALFLFIVATTLQTLFGPTSCIEIQLYSYVKVLSLCRHLRSHHRNLVAQLGSLIMILRGRRPAAGYLFTNVCSRCI